MLIFDFIINLFLMYTLVLKTLMMFTLFLYECACMLYVFVSVCICVSVGMCLCFDMIYSLLRTLANCHYLVINYGNVIPTGIITEIPLSVVMDINYKLAI